MFTFPLPTHELFEERRQQFVAWGIPQETVKRVEARVKDAWSDAPGGWTYEWVLEAEKAKSKEDWMLAASLFGAARFPCLATPSRIAALTQQAECFELASHAFPLHFERQVVPCDVGGRTVLIPVHIYAPKGGAQLPMVLLSGGVDTGKMELHRVCLLLSKLGKLRVVAIDMPGTGESDTALNHEADSIYKTVIETFRGNGKVGVLGVSFGGHWAAKLALRHEVDACVNFGGPIGVNGIDGAYVAALPNGMPGILGNAMRLSEYPDEFVADRMLKDFSLRDQGLLEQPDCARMLAVNGADDQYIPSADVDVFRGYPSAEVWRLRGLTHCAAEKIMRVVPAMVTWLRKELHGDSFKNRVLYGAALKILPEKI